MAGNRGPWGQVFLASGLLAMVASLIALGTSSALPYAVVLWMIAVYTGYRIWSAAHPEASFMEELSRRTVAVIGFGAVIVVASSAQANLLAALVIIGVLYAVMTALMYFVNRTLR